MKIKKNEQGRIEAINQEIETLLHERQKITEALTQNFVNWLMKKNALAHDYETLVGGIASILSVIERNDAEATVQKEIWKQAGSKSKNKR